MKTLAAGFWLEWLVGGITSGDGHIELPMHVGYPRL